MKNLTLREKLYAYPRAYFMPLKLDIKWLWYTITKPDDPDVKAVQTYCKTATRAQKRELRYFHIKPDAFGFYWDCVLRVIHWRRTDSERRDELVKLFKNRYHLR